jgi:GrpB-like predicted nucleotidyltransferase (UPF0157 family)
LKKNISSKQNETRRVIVTAYQPGWHDCFEREALAPKDIFKGEILEIHHIGSTSITGMPAKPTIDMLMVVKDIQQIDRYNPIMSQKGYHAKGENEIEGRRFFFNGNDLVHTFHLHIFQTSSTEIKRHLNFRNFLIAHKEEARQYAQLKIQLSNEYPANVDTYQEGKNEFIKAIDQKAGIWAETIDGEPALD